MGLMTLVMALLTVAGLVAAVAAVVVAPAGLAMAVVALLAGLLVVAAAERVDGYGRSRTPLGARGAAVVALWPVVLMFGGQIACVAAIQRGLFGPPASAVALLLGYLAATGPWTLAALIAPRRFRTVRGVRAFAAHSAIWLLALGRLALGAGWPAAIALQMPAAILPLAIAYVVARAGDADVRHVRI